MVKGHQIGCGLRGYSPLSFLLLNRSSHFLVSIIHAYICFIIYVLVFTFEHAYILQCNYWRAKRALNGDMDGKLHIVVHACMWYIYVCPYFHNPRSARKILRTQLKKRMVCMENSPWRSLD